MKYIQFSHTNIAILFKKQTKLHVFISDKRSILIFQQPQYSKLTFVTNRQILLQHTGFNETFVKLVIVYVWKIKQKNYVCCNIIKYSVSSRSICEDRSTYYIAILYYLFLSLNTFFIVIYQPPLFEIIWVVDCTS